MLAWVKEKGLEAKGGKSIEKAIKEYVVLQLEVNGRKLGIQDETKTPFAQELKRYMRAKVQRKPLCSLCSSS